MSETSLISLNLGSFTGTPISCHHFHHHNILSSFSSPSIILITPITRVSMIQPGKVGCSITTRMSMGSPSSQRVFGIIPSLLDNGMVKIALYPVQMPICLYHIRIYFQILWESRLLHILLVQLMVLLVFISTNSSNHSSFIQ